MSDRKTKRTGGRSPAPADPITAFFDGIARQGVIPMLERTTGTVRFDVLDRRGEEHWHVAITKGAVKVTHRSSRADSVARVQRPVFEAICAGTLNANAASLRSTMVPQGDLALLVAFERLFPGPPGSTGRVAPITEVPQERTR